MPGHMETSRMNDSSPIPPDSAEVRIRGEDLKSRIMGFGSGGVLGLSFIFPLKLKKGFLVV